jgi:iron complex transport system substrate-binding protein
MAASRFPRALLFVAVLLASAACATSGPSSIPTTISTAPSSVAAPSPTPAPSFPVTLTDDEGTMVEIVEKPERIVSLTPSSTEILFAIGAGDRVVGKTEDTASFPPESVTIPDLATFAGVDVEQIVAAEPDLVISAGTGLTQGDAVEQLRRADITVLVAYPTTIDDALAGIRMIGRAVGAGGEAQALATSMRQEMDDLAALASSAPERPRVFYEIDVTGGIFTPPGDSIYGEMLTLAGSDPISGDANYSISLENLVDADPEVILLGDAAYGVTAEAVAARPGWEDMTAVREERIVPIDDIVVTRPGPRLVDGLRALIEAIHPELELPSMSPEASAAPSASGAAYPTIAAAA